MRIQRYNCEYCNLYDDNDMCEAKEGEWVRYDDIKHLLERSDKSDYTAPFKLPSLEEVIEHLDSVGNGLCLHEDIKRVYNAIKKLAKE